MSRERQEEAYDKTGDEKEDMATNGQASSLPANLGQFDPWNGLGVAIPHTLKQPVKPRSLD
jgi:hypothetical protein